MHCEMRNQLEIKMRFFKVDIVGVFFEVHAALFLAKSKYVGRAGSAAAAAAAVYCCCLYKIKIEF